MRLIAPEAPPWSLALNTVLQHVLSALTFLVFSLLAGQALRLEGRELSDFLALGILVMGFGTLLNGLTTPISAGHLLVKIPAPTMLAVFIVVVETSGAGPAMGGVLAGAFLVLLLGRFLPRLRVLFPAEITGIVVFLLGLSLIPPGMGRVLGEQALSGGGVALDSLLVGATTLVPIIAFSVWSRGRMAIFAPLIGVVGAGCSQG